MSNNKTIILHIGPTKTGSTSIQAMLAENQAELLEQGFLYPSTGRPKKQKGYILNRPSGCRRLYGPITAHHLLVWSLMREVEEVNSEELLEILHREITDSSAHTAILSAEIFTRLRKHEIELLENLLKGHQIKIVAYQRDIFSRSLSRYTQAVKTGLFSGSFRDYIEAHSDDAFVLERVIPVWRKVFDEVHIEIKDFDVAKKKGIELDFLCFIGLTPNNISKILISNEQKNKSPSPAAIRIICWINRIENLLGKPQIIKAFLGRIRETLSSKDITKKINTSSLNKPLWNNNDRDLLLEKSSNFSSKR